MEFGVNLMIAFSTIAAFLKTYDSKSFNNPLMKTYMTVYAIGFVYLMSFTLARPVDFSYQEVSIILTAITAHAFLVENIHLRSLQNPHNDDKQKLWIRKWFLMIVFLSMFALNAKPVLDSFRR
jgi:predicted Abi (CAAX) family protease